jgi:hypothetical protein
MARRIPRSRLKIIRAKWGNLTRQPDGSYRSKSGVRYTARQGKQRRLYERTGQKLSLEGAAKLRRQELLGYETAATEAQAGKQRATAARKKIDRFLADPASTYRDYRYGEKRLLTDNMRSEYLNWRERRLAGEELDMDEFGPMMDTARAVNDVALVRIVQS